MKFTLKDYQEEAVADVLVNMRKASKRWQEDGDIHAFSLTATTGAGKTVMAAAVFEAMFYGEDTFDFEADPTAAVIWFSDDPSLNEQTRFRLLEATDKLDITDLVVIQNTFNREKFEPGKIYFINTQKLRSIDRIKKGGVKFAPTLQVAVEAEDKQIEIDNFKKHDINIEDNTEVIVRSIMKDFYKKDSQNTKDNK